MSGMEVVKRWHVREAFFDMTWGGYGRGRRIGTGKGCMGQCSRVVVQVGASKGCGGRAVVDARCRVRMMASDVAQWKRGWFRLTEDNAMVHITRGGEESR